MKAVRSSICVFVLCFSLIFPASIVRAGGIPVIDVAAIAQAIMQYMKQIEDLAEQVRHYQMLVKQYEDMAMNSAQPALYIWSQVENTMEDITNLQAELDRYSKMGSAAWLQHLKNYGNLNGYRGHKFWTTGSQEDFRDLLEEEVVWSNTQHEANLGLAAVLGDQKASLDTSADRLHKLQSAAAAAKGRLQAIQYGNQLLAQQANQLLEMRAMMAAQAAAENARAMAVAAKEARERAAWEKLTESRYVKSPQQKMIDFR